MRATLENFRVDFFIFGIQRLGSSNVQNMKILKPNNFRELTLASVWLVVQGGPLRSGKGQWEGCSNQKDVFLPPP